MNPEPPASADAEVCRVLSLHSGGAKGAHHGLLGRTVSSVETTLGPVLAWAAMRFNGPMQHGDIVRETAAEATTPMQFVASCITGIHLPVRDLKKAVMFAGVQLRVLRISPLIGVFIWLAGAAGAQNIVVDAAPFHAVNSFSPFRALGGAIDRLRGGSTKEQNEKHTERVLTDPVLKELLGAGWQTVTYRQNTELMIEAWHWNSRGTWNDGLVVHIPRRFRNAGFPRPGR
jgi:hypothetical protein